MGITTNSLTQERGPFGKPATALWCVNGSSADASSCEELVAAPGAGYALVVERLVIALGAAITATIGAGESSDNVEEALIGPIGGAAGTYPLDFREYPIVLKVNKSLTVDTSGSGQVCVYAEGYTRLSDQTLYITVSDGIGIVAGATISVS